MASKPFIEGVFEYEGNSVRLIAGKCTKCGKLSFPKRFFCPLCHSEAIEKVYLSKRGKIYTYTISHTTSLEYLSAPYAIGYVDLPEGVRVFTLFKDWQEKELKIGKDAEICLGKLKEDTDGTKVVTYMFKPT
jgi:uncharacterized OB-fold protein